MIQKQTLIFSILLNLDDLQYLAHKIQQPIPKLRKFVFFFGFKSFTSFVWIFFHQKQSDLFIKSWKYFRNNLITLWVSEKIANHFWCFNFFYLETDIPPKDKKLWHIFVGSKKKQYISHIKLNCNWMMMCFHKIFHLYFHFYDFSKL